MGICCMAQESQTGALCQPSSILAWKFPQTAWQAIVHGVTKSQTQLSAHTYYYTLIFLNPKCLPICCLVSKSSLILLQHRGLQPARLHSPWYSPGKNIGVDCHPLLQGVFPKWIKPMSLMSAALARGFFATSATWEAHNNYIWKIFWYVLTKF